MKSYKELEKDFDNQVKLLQARCKHKKTEWMEQWWVIGHSTGYSVEVCDFCNKVINERKCK